MSDSIKVSIKGVDEIRRKYGAGKVKAALREGMQDSVDLVIDKMPQYPSPPAPGVWAANTTRRQKAAFFAQLRAGGWKRRTGQLGRSLTGRVEEAGSSVRGIVGTNRPGAQFVVGTDTQAKFHQKRWWTLYRAARDQMPEIKRIITGKLRGLK